MRVLYSTYDITDLLKDGENAVGIMIGNGWWGKGLRSMKQEPRARLQMNIRTLNGDSQIVTDMDWKGIDGIFLMPLSLLIFS